MARILWSALVALMLLPEFATLQAQTSTASTGTAAFVPGNRELFALDFSREPLGGIPSSLNVLSGSMAVVQKDGTHMLRASSPSEFIVPLNERLPDHFTLEFDVVSRTSMSRSNDELAFEGTPILMRNAGSAQILWNHLSLNIQGGGVSGGDTWVTVPEELSAELMGQLAQVRVEFDGLRFKLFTNGRLLYNLPELRFVRGRVLRVFLGGQDDQLMAVHLARLRVAAFDSSAPAVAQQQSAMTATDQTLQQPSSTVASSTTSVPASQLTVTGITVTVNSSGFASVTWNPLPVPATYFVVRWKPDDPLCCYNVSPPGRPLTSTSWQDGLLPTPGTYGYRVIATTSGGLVSGETLYSYQGTPTPPPGVASTGTVATVSPPLSPGPVTTVASTSFPTATTTTTPTTGVTATGTSGTGTILNPDGAQRTTAIVPATTTPAVTAVPAATTGTITPMAAPPPARYRVLLTGFAAAKQTNDDPLQLDGRGDEVYAAAAVVNWDRRLNQLTSFSFVQTREYGDIGDGTFFPTRIKAGTFTMTGGIKSGDRVPSTYDVTGANLPTPATDQFPLLVWEGTLTAGVEALVIAPSLWERDTIRLHFTSYKTNWSSASPAAVLTSPTVTLQYTNTSVTSAVVPLDPLTVAAPPAPTFMGPVTNGYKIAVLAFGPSSDRPIGMSTFGLGVVSYQERLMLITQEKLASLNVGDGVTLAIPYAEPIDIFLNGIYTLYVRVQRLQ